VINGNTKTVMVAADPVAHLRTPQALNDIWVAEGRDLITVPAHVAPSHLVDFVAGMKANASVCGAVITVPHKQSIAVLCDDLRPQARIVGAVNVVRREPDGTLVGETFDGLGFVHGLRSEGIDPTGMRVVLLGAGGAASAIAVALLEAGIRHLDVDNRTAPRAIDLADRLRGEFPARDIGTGLDRLHEADLVVNATSSGLAATDSSPLAGAAFPAAAIAADVVISDRLTPFLTAATDRGLRAHGGQHMLAGQVRLIAEFLTAAPQ
jgi:shikimate dehydrogenase